MEKRVKKENNSDHLKQLPLIFFCISFWFFFYSMHWLYFYDIVMYWSFQILKNCNEPLTPLSISPYNPFLHTFALLSWLLNHHIFLAIFLSSVGGSWFSTCFSQCWHYLRISLRLFFFPHSRPFSQGSPSTFMDSIAPDLCLQRSYMSQFAMSIHRCGPSRGPEGHKTRTQSLVGRDWLLQSPWIHVRSLIHVYTS